MSAKEKEPWEMTQDEYIAEYHGGDGAEYRAIHEALHKQIVEARLRQQTPKTRRRVPYHALVEYPDLYEQEFGVKLKLNPTPAPSRERWVAFPRETIRDRFHYATIPSSGGFSEQDIKADVQAAIGQGLISKGSVPRGYHTKDKTIDVWVPPTPYGVFLRKLEAGEIPEGSEYIEKPWSMENAGKIWFRVPDTALEVDTELLPPIERPKPRKHIIGQDPTRMITEKECIEGLRGLR